MSNMTVSKSVTLDEELNRLRTIVDFVTRHNNELEMEVLHLKKRLTEVELEKNCLEYSFQTDEICISENASWFESCLKIIQDANTILEYPQLATSCSPESVSSVKGKIVNILSSEPKDIVGFTHNVTMFLIFAVSIKNSDTKKLIKKFKEVARISTKILKAWNDDKNANEFVKRLINTVNHIESIVAMEENGSLNVKDAGEKFDDETVIVDLMNSVFSLTGRRPFKRELPNEFINEFENITKRLKLEGGVIGTPVKIKIKRSCPFDTVSRAPKQKYFEIISSKMVSPQKRKKLLANSVM